MKNGYFQLVECLGGTGLKVFPPEGDGEKVRINEVIDYLLYRNIIYDLSALNKELTNANGKEVVIPLNNEMLMPERETYLLNVSEDNMKATARFYAPSQGGEKMTYNGFVNDLKHRNITYGINEFEVLTFFEKERTYCTDIVVAQGKPPRHGTDAKIEYYFQTDLNVKPTMNEDGSVDFFHLNTICHCGEGQLLAKLIPADLGEYGINIINEKIKPRDVKKAVLKFGRNIKLSEDRQSITSEVDGHVTLVEGKVFVSNILEVENVDNSTGNIDYEGSVQVNGNVCSNFTVKAKGNIDVKGVVEGAELIAGGDIVIARGVNGMNKGSLQAEGNIVAKFMENVNVKAKGYISTESILHSKVYSGTDITVSGKKGFITGGDVCATNSVNVKTLGSPLGASTNVEVGADPTIKLRFLELQKQAAEIQRALRTVTPVVEAYEAKKDSGIALAQEQLKYILSLKQLKELKEKELEKCAAEMETLQDIIEDKNQAQVIVTGEVFPGTKIVISEVSMVVQSNMKYCRFIKSQGDVKMVSI